MSRPKPPLPPLPSMPVPITWGRYVATPDAPVDIGGRVRWRLVGPGVDRWFTWRDRATAVRDVGEWMRTTGLHKRCALLDKGQMIDFIVRRDTMLGLKKLHNAGERHRSDVVNVHPWHAMRTDLIVHRLAIGGADLGAPQDHAAALEPGHRLGRTVGAFDEQLATLRHHANAEPCDPGRALLRRPRVRLE